MEILSKHIEFLLLRHDCVIVPGIGAFINLYTPPYFEPVSQRMIPPCKEVVFNSSLKSDDGLLANSYARKNNISYREGSELLSGDVKLLTDFLNTENEVTIGRLGLIRKEDEGNIRFIPFKTPELSSALLGFDSVPVPRLDSVTGGESNNNPVSSTQSTELQIETGAISHSPDKNLSNKKFEKEFDTEKNYYIPVNKFFSKICAAVFVICFLTIICLNLPYRVNPNEEQASFLPVDQVIETAVERISSFNKESKDINRDALETSQDDLMKNDIVNPQYHLIVATCTTREEAERFMSKKEGSGYDLHILPSSKYFRVAACNDSDRERLISVMQSPEFKASFTESWIMKE